LKKHKRSAIPRHLIRELLGISETLSVECIISIRYPVRELRGLPRERLEWDNIKGNRCC
jgi:hypothetical protein